LRTLFIGIALMVAAIVLSFVATTDDMDRFDRDCDVSGAVDLTEERSFLENRSAMESRISIVSDHRINVTVKNGGQSAGVYTKDLELSYIPEAISVEGSAHYECSIVASAGKPYLFLSLPALICSLLGFAILLSSIARASGRKD